MYLHLNISEQVLSVYLPEKVITYPVSTALNGVGEAFGSGCTPRGLHTVRAKIGENLPLNAVFVGRRFTGEIYSSQLAERYPQRDWILTRILWLSGKEPGRNRLSAVDSMRRYIYIHGTPDTEPMGIPVSHGCIRMRNADVLELYNLIPVGSELLIEEY
ncbi:L,D-transpeptidase [Neptunomonas antarctica]|uniref:L,D-transpeptidase catalytic domain n=1 Tax=Neptunomonas antarctica TaxID=619304 RepID=A0A1N7LS04_9GAMM|nr:L,D-transpeptidase [Neptunomonas antarctica]SIS76574.1 L,D-transpeptidase catalytic domain [Neptunomonas antarctica]